MSRLLPGRRASASGGNVFKKANDKPPPPPPPSASAKASLEAISLPTVVSSSTSGTFERVQNEMIRKLLSASLSVLETALPCNSGNPLEVVEASISTERSRIGLIGSAVQNADIVLMALCDFLKKIQKRIPADGAHSKEVLESELYILKTMVQALDLCWPTEVEPSSNATSDNKAEPNGHSSEGQGSAYVPKQGSTRIPSPKASSSSLRSTSTSISWIEPRALSDHTAEHILDTIQMYLSEDAQFGRVTDELFPWKVLEWVPSLVHPTRVKGRNTNQQYKASKGQRQARNRLIFDPVEDLPIYGEHTVYTHEETRDESLHGSFLVSVPILIRRYASRIVYHLSASNWHIVFGRIKSRLHTLVQENEARPSSAGAHVFPPNRSLRSVLSGEGKTAAVTSPLKEQFTSSSIRRILDGLPERLFEVLRDYCKENSKRASTLYPVLAVLLAISPERLESAHPISDGIAKVTRKDYFLAALEHTLVPENWGFSKGKPNLGQGPEHAAYAYLDLINLSFLLRSSVSEEDFVLHSLGPSMAQDLKSYLLNLPALKTPFYLSSEPIDVNFCAYAIVAIFRFHPVETLHQLLKPCLDPGRSHAAKLVAVKALTILNTETSKYPLQPKLDDTFPVVTVGIRNILTSIAGRKSYIVDGVIQHPSTMPICKSYARMMANREVAAKNIDERTRVFLAIVALLCYDLRFFIHEVSSEEVQHAINDVKGMLLDDNDPQERISTIMGMALTFKQAIRTTAQSPHYKQVSAYLRATSMFRLRSAAVFVLMLWEDKASARMGLRALHSMLEEIVYGSFEDPDDWRFSDAMNSELLVVEISLLNALSCADMTITKAALQSLRLVCMLKRHPSMPTPTYCSRIDHLKRYSFFEAMCTIPPTVGGQAAFHKRIRKYTQLSSIATPVRSIMLRLILERFLKYTAKIKSLLQESDQSSAVDLSRHFDRDEMQEWRNLMFSVLSAIRLDIDPEGDNFLPDVEEIFPRTTPISKAGAIDIIKKFMSDIISLLDANNLSVREAAKEALGIELNIRAVPMLFESLDSQLARRLSEGKKEVNRRLLIFLEQVLFVLGTIFERLDGSIPVFENNIAENLTNVGLLINQVPTTDTVALLLRLRFCSTSISLLTKRKVIAIREENKFRNQLSDLAADWLNERADEGGSRPELQKLCSDVRLTTIKLIVLAVECLKFPCPQESANSELAQESSRRINYYIETLLRSLPTGSLQNISDSASHFDQMSEKSEATYNNEAFIQELVISGIAHILNQNSEIAKRFCIAKCYDDNLRIRVLFMKVFTRVLNRGIKLDQPKIAVAVNEHDGFCKMIRDTQALSMSILRTCSSAEEEELTPILLRVFNNQQSLITFLKLIVDVELSETDSPAQFLRSNNVRIRILSLFLRNHGYHYLRKMVKALISILKKYSAEESFEIEVSKVPEGMDLTSNIDRVISVTHEFIEILASSYEDIPSTIREIARYFASVITPIWPDSKYRTLGAFFFLRFLAPVIVSPDYVNIIVDNETKCLRRGLISVARVLQSIANQSYAVKRDYVSTNLSRFMENHDPIIVTFLSHVLEAEPTRGQEVENELYTGCDEADGLVLRKFVDSHSDKIGNDFIGGKMPEKEFASWKDTWDAMLLDSRTATESPEVNSENANEHLGFKQFMARNRHRNPATYRDLFLVRETPTGIICMLFFSKITSDVVDFELLLYSIFKRLIGILNNHDYDVVFDFTGFSSRSRIPISWLKRALELFPADIQAKWRTSYLVNTSSVAQSYLREIFCIFSDLRLSRQCSATSSVEELRGLLPIVPFLPKGSLLGLSGLDEDSFYPVHYLIEGRSWKLGSMHVGGNYARIVSTKPKRLASTLSSPIVEVIDFHDVEDIHKSQDKRCVILRFYRGLSMTVEIDEYEDLWKCLTEAKQRSTEDDKTPLLPASKTSDTSATLLAVGLLHCCHTTEFIRGAAYELLAANCAYLSYPVDEYIPWRGSFIPANLLAYISIFCDRLSQFAPQLTLDFILEWYNGFVNASNAQKLISIQYLRPWIRNLDRFADPATPGYNLEKLQECIFIFVDISMQEGEVYPLLQRSLWMEVALLSSTSILDILFGKLLRVALDHGIGSFKCDQAGDILLLLSSMHIRSRILTELRTTLFSACSKHSKSIRDTDEWPVIAVLTRLSLTSAHHPRVMGLTQVCVPEIAFVVTMLAGLGALTMRLSVYGLVCNLIQSLLVSRAGDDSSTLPLRRLSDEMNTRPMINLFGLDRPYASAEIGGPETMSQTLPIDSIEKITELLVRILEVGAGSSGLDNVWRARWTSLASSIAFRPSPFAQSRGFITLSVLIVKPLSKVEPDFFREMLSFCARTISHMDEERDAFVALLRCIRHAVRGLETKTPYLISLTFWIAMSILQAGPTLIFDEVLSLIEETVSTMDERGFFPSARSYGEVLMNARRAVGDAGAMIDNLSAISFETDCGFGLTVCIWNGVKNPHDVASVRRALSTLLKLAVRKTNPSREKVSCLDPLSLTFWLGLGPCMDRSTHLKMLQECHVDVEDSDDDDEEYPITFEMLGIKDEKTAFLGINLLKATEDHLALHSSEQENVHCLWWALAERYPEVFSASVWHSIGLAREDWLKKKINSYFSATTQAHLKAVVSTWDLVIANSSQAVETPEITPNTSLSSLPITRGLSGSSSSFTNISAIHSHTPHGRRLNEYGMAGIMELYRRAHKPNYEADAALRREILKHVKLLIELALAQGG
ncbi:hypothetical protein M422DRAFT_34700 [Sphaerobolus stellatus SS14]|uniref:Ras-GAP domain-containing protein n=1 Tax=Sphaerobolus stellatus (strain SS14) TaxID=990650 RepID=A0A0C9VD13_SPHS4|nr:hypothetical protein M422DRAFT_34700 [Sphaerobolus stellatus SS14]